ncbi:ATP-grasp domain-containing protein [Candidatus Woesearchaeota archaeon]|nr:ATP-grasp domain-containing protein [Candidatus Woesearchaeota archaeon]
MRVAVVYSVVDVPMTGDPADLAAERDVLRSVEGIAEALPKLGHTVVKVPFSRTLYADLRRIRPDMLFNLCDSFEGPSTLEATVPAIAEMLDLPYTGSGMLAVSLCLDKARTKAILSAVGIPNARFQLFSKPDGPLDRDLRFPLIVKPNNEDASLGIRRGCVVTDEKALRKRLEETIRIRGQPAIVEEFIDGREFDIALLGNDDPQALPISETVFRNFAPGEFRVCDYEAKWIEGDRHYDDLPSEFPAKLPEKVAERMRSLARAAHRLTGCSGYTRVEMRLRGEEPFVIEVNPNPDISPGGQLFRLAASVGIGERELMKKVLDFGLERHRQKRWRLEGEMRQG